MPAKIFSAKFIAPKFYYFNSDRRRNLPKMVMHLAGNGLRFELPVSSAEFYFITERSVTFPKVFWTPNLNFYRKGKFKLA